MIFSVGKWYDIYKSTDFCGHSSQSERNEMKIQETWSIPPERIRKFPQSQEGFQQSGLNGFLFGQCEIELTILLDGRMGSICIPRTQVVFEGEKEETEVIHRRFVLRFLSAGG